jgi:hypothetical protein
MIVLGTDFPAKTVSTPMPGDEFTMGDCLSCHEKSWVSSSRWDSKLALHYDSSFKQASLPEGSMDPTIVLPAAALAVAQICSLVGLWLRLRWRARTELAQQAQIVRLAREAPGSRLLVEDDQGDGRRLRVCLTPTGTLRGREDAA